jgi:PTH1 family peptidyl-tRNA hydrolase
LFPFFDVIFMPILLIGLGNPGPAYAKTRHNLGASWLDALALSWGAEVWCLERRFEAYVCKARVGGVPCLLAKPQTYMNASGQSARALCRFYDLKPQQVLVLYDEVELLLGQLRLRQGGGTAGHRGLRDIVRVMGPDVHRARLGIGPKPQGPEAYDTLSAYVLAPFSPREQAALVQCYPAWQAELEAYVLIMQAQGLPE